MAIGRNEHATNEIPHLMQCVDTHTNQPLWTDSSFIFHSSFVFVGSKSASGLDEVLMWIRWHFIHVIYRTTCTQISKHMNRQFRESHVNELPVRAWNTSLMFSVFIV